MTPISNNAPTDVRHIELGKTLIKKALHFEAFDHFKKSIHMNPECAIDILTYLYKNQFNQDSDPDIELIIAKIYIEINMQNEAFEVIEEALMNNPKHEATYEALAKLITKNNSQNRIKQCFEKAIENHIFSINHKYFAKNLPGRKKLYKSNCIIQPTHHH